MYLGMISGCVVVPVYQVLELSSGDFRVCGGTSLSSSTVSRADFRVCVGTGLSSSTCI